MGARWENAIGSDLVPSAVLIEASTPARNAQRICPPRELEDRRPGFQLQRLMPRLLMIKDLSGVALIDLLPANRARVEIVACAPQLATMALSWNRRPEVR